MTLVQGFTTEKFSPLSAPGGTRSCYWGGFGGSVIIRNQDMELTIAYATNKMVVGQIGDTRGPELAFAAAMAAMS